MQVGSSLVVQWLRPHAFNAGGTGVIFGWGTKIPRLAVQPKNKTKQKIMQAVDISLELFLCLAPAYQYLPQKQLIHSSEQHILIFATAAQRTDHLALGANRAYLCGPPRTEYICILINLLPEGLASSQTESRCWNPPLWNTILGTSSTNGSHLPLVQTQKFKDKQKLWQGWMKSFTSSMRPLLQDWEKWLFLLLYRNQHRESSEMKTQRNMFQVS